MDGHSRSISSPSSLSSYQAVKPRWFADTHAVSRHPHLSLPTSALSSFLSASPRPPPPSLPCSLAPSLPRSLTHSHIPSLPSSLPPSHSPSLSSLEPASLPLFLSPSLSPSLPFSLTPFSPSYAPQARALARSPVLTRVCHPAQSAARKQRCTRAAAARRTVRRHGSLTL